MASISGVSGSNMTSSLYNSANIISGLASGLDTEGMIEGLVQGYQTKIQSLTNKTTKLEWKQEAYRSIISKMYAFSNKYTSYTSSTNLMSTSFFNNAINVAAMGANKDKITASGRTDSDIRVTSVKQLATSARYSTASNLKGIDNNFAIMAEKPVKFGDDFDTGTLSGSLTLTYGSKTVSLVFDPDTDMISNDLSASEKAEELGKLIEKKLGDAKITLSSGETKDATDLIDVSYSNGKISFKDKSTGGNVVYISSASGTVGDTLGLDLQNADKEKPNTIKISSDTKLTKTQDVGSYISGASMNVSLDGKSKTIKLPEIKETYDGTYQIKDENGQYVALTKDNYADAVQKALDKEFGAGKITVTNEGGEDSLQLKFQASANSDLIINTNVGKALGIGNISTNYLNTSKTLGELMDSSAWIGLPAAKAVGSISTKDGKLVDDAGNLVNSAGNLVDKDGNELYAFKVNGVTIGNYGKGTKLSAIMSDLNANNEAGVKANYSQTTRKFTFTTKDTGVENEIAFDGLAKAIFGDPGDAGSGTYTKGQDAVFAVEINGDQMEMTRGSNNFSLDGMTLNLKGTFNESAWKDDGSGKVSFDWTDPANTEAVTFQRSTDSDKIVDAVRSMINDYNEMMSEIRSQYATLPYQNSSGAFQTYEPLTDEDKATMSESAIQNYEAKAKQGLLFNDSNLSGLYSKMLGIFTDGSKTQQELSQMGISITYSSADGSAALALDENKLRSALDSDPDAVADVFTRSVAGGSSSDGIMQQMKAQLDRYGATTGATKGILVEQAGTPLSSLTLMNNYWQKQIDNINTEIEKWQDKLSAQVDKYTSMFSKLEVLINQMNSQSSTLAGLMGG